MIYVLSEDSTTYVKIGSTRSTDGLKGRMIKLNEGNPRQLRAIAQREPTTPIAVTVLCRKQEDA